MILNYTISPPFAFQAGDVFLLNGYIYEQWRSGVKIDERNLLQMSKAPLVEPFHSGDDQITNLFLEKPMPGTNVSCTNVQENQATGAVTFSFSDDENLEIANWEAVGAIADTVDADGQMGRNILMGRAFRASPDGSNKTTQVGASVSVNLQADTPIAYIPPV